MLFQCLGKRSDDQLCPFSAETRVGQVVLGVFTNGTLEGLAGEAGTLDAPEDGSFWVNPRRRD
jgi:hypothetical protein